MAEPSLAAVRQVLLHYREAMLASRRADEIAERLAARAAVELDEPAFAAGVELARRRALRERQRLRIAEAALSEGGPPHHRAWLTPDDFD